MSVAWTIGGHSLASLGLEVANATFRAGAASELTLRRVAAFDAAPLYNYDAPITLVRAGTPYFSGKVKSRPAWGRSSGEGQIIRIADAWQDLEDTVYMEPWAIGTGSTDYPMAVLGVDSSGSAITSGEQIEEAISYAISAGVDLQLGTVPAGLPLWPSEVRNVSCAEVIRLSLRFHPDWVPWIDHSTTPPTFNVTARAALDVRTLDLSGSGDVESFSIQRRDDLKPESVRIVYANATIIDGVTYRDHVIDKWPAAGPDEGPRVLSSLIELAGGQMQFQKSRIQTRTLPTDQASAKTWLKLKFPHLKDVPDAHMAVSGFLKELVDETEDHPDPVNPRAERLEVEDATDLPRELVRGSIEDWMRRKVGKIRITAKVRPAAGASAASKAALSKALSPVTVTGTNAVTKIYKGVTSWVAPESAPAGIARAVFESLESYQFDGDVTQVLQDVSATRWHGAAVNLTGGLGEWATMKAMIHQATVDIDSGTVSLSFGPAPFLAAEDFLELQRLLRGRRPTWTSQEERISNELGAESAPGSKGDTVGGYDQPETLIDPAGGASFSATIVPVAFSLEEEVWSVEFTPAKLWEQSLKNPGLAHPIVAGDPATALTADPAPLVELETGANDVWLVIGIDAAGKVAADSVQLVIGDEPDATQFEPNRPSGGGVTGTHVQKVGTITVVDAATEPLWIPECTSAVLHVFVPEMESVGEGISIYNNYAAGKDQFRSHKQEEPEGDWVPVLRPEEDASAGDPEADPPVPAVEGYTQGTEIRHMAFGPRPTSPQITFVRVDGKNEVRGNGNGWPDGMTVSGYRLTSISWNDGLVTGATAAAEDEEEGWWGGLDWYNGGGTEALRLSVANGRIVGVIKGEVISGDYEENAVPGTEATPGYANILV